MTREEFEIIEKMKDCELITGEDLVKMYGMKDKTLLYGYTCSRQAFHVYLKGGGIHAVVYDDFYKSWEDSKPSGAKDMWEVNVTCNHNYRPDKRLYPERCDFTFCKLLQQRGVDLYFTSWNDNVEPQVFYGFTLEEDISVQKEEVK